MTQKLLILSFILLQGLNTIAQTVFEQGYYIDNNNNKFTGLIKVDNTSGSPNYFQFKESRVKNIQDIYSEECKEFGINYHNQRYIRFNGNLDSSSQDKSELSENRIPNNVYKATFVEEILLGNASLYRYKTKRITLFLFQTDEQPLQPLVYKQYKPRKQKIQKNEEYKIQLKKAFQNVEGIEELVSKLSYTEKQLSSFFLKINKLQNIEYNGEVHDKKQNVEVFIKSGVQFYNYEPNYETSTHYFDQVINGTGVNLGMNLNYYISSDQKKLAFVFDYNVWQNNDEVPTSVAIDSGQEHNISLKVTGFEHQYGLKYFFHLTPKANLWASANYCFLIANHCREEIKHDTQKDAKYTAKHNENFFKLGIGFTYKNRWVMELKSNMHSFYDSEFFHFAHYSHTQLQVGYRIF